LLPHVSAALADAPAESRVALPRLPLAVAVADNAGCDAPRPPERRMRETLAVSRSRPLRRLTTTEAVLRA